MYKYICIGTNTGREYEKCESSCSIAMVKLWEKLSAQYYKYSI